MPTEPHVPTTTASALPAELARRVPARIRALALLVSGGVLLSWLPSHASSGTVLTEPSAWAPELVVLLASAIVLVLSWRAPRALGDVGTIYQVVVSYGIAFCQHWGSFDGLEAAELTADRVGYSGAAVWMLCFSMLVPQRASKALLALVLSSAAPLTVFLCAAAIGEAPALAPSDIFFVWVLRYAIVVAAAFAASRMIHGRGRQPDRGRVLGSYRLEQRVGRGGMGEVWRARHEMLSRLAAVKLVRPDAVDHGDDSRSHALRGRFEREAQVTASLASPHTVDLYDYGVTEEGELYYVMELLDGIDLETFVREHGPLEPTRVIEILRQVCHSLAEAHSKGLVHRDVKPSNIVLCRRGLDHDFVKVIDFGLVGLRAGLDEEERISREMPVAGTPAYLAPEAIVGSVDARADVYALGCVAHWLLTGARVFEADDVVETLRAHLTEAPEPPSSQSELAIPQALDALVLRCLAKDPAERPASMSAIVEALDACPRPRAWSRDDAERWWQLHRPARASLAPRAPAPPRPSIEPMAAWA